MSKYPIYTSQPFTGNLPTMVEMGPSDLRPSAGMARSHIRRLTQGRHLAGFGASELAPESDVPPLPANTVVSDDTNELRRLECEDDVVGNGIFDDNKRVKINYADAGIFASSFSMPGYVHRSKSFMPSEVRDITTGRQTVYVPGGAVSIDDAAKVAFVEGNSFIPLRRYNQQPRQLPGVSTVNPSGSAKPVSYPTQPMVDSGATQSNASQLQLTVSQASVPAMAVAAAAAASNDRALTPVQLSIAAPTRPLVVAPPADNSRWWLAGIAVAMGFGVGMVLTKKKGTP